MAYNEKIRTEDVVEILDTKIKTTASHAQLGVITGEYYDSVLAKIAARSPTLSEKDALDAAQSPSASNPFVTRAEFSVELAGKIPWRTIGSYGSGATYEGTTESAFNAAFAAGHTWILVLAGTYTMASGITIPAGVKLQGASAASVILSGSSDSILTLNSDCMVSNLTVALQTTGSAIVGSGLANVELQNVIVTTLAGGIGLSLSESSVRVFDCSFQTGVVTLSSCYDSTFLSVLFDTPADALLLATPINISVTACIFKNGRLNAIDGRYVRAVGNHFEDGISAAPWGLNFTFAPADVDVVTNEIIHPLHGLLDGDKVLLYSSVVLPSPLITSMYFVTGTTTSSFQLALTVGGLAIDLTDQGTGIHSLELRENLFRANTPNTVNNDGDDLFALVEYIGAPDTTSSEPLYANNYGGPAGQDLTARASALDLLTQWRYEERNFLMLASAEPWTVTWAPATHTLTTTSSIRLQSIHRDKAWVLPTINTVVADGYALYYIIDRSLTTADIDLTPYQGPLGSIPNNSDNRQVWVLAFCIGSTLWWRGNGGARFPSTGGEAGTYFIDGTSKSILDYIGATAVNDAYPNYSSNFAGVQGESLTVRASKTDKLIKHLFEYSNLNWMMDGYIGFDEPTLTISGTLYLTFPHVIGRITLSSLTQTMASGDMLALSWDMEALAGVDTAASMFMTSFGSLPIPEDNQTVKYMAFAWRTGDSVYLFDGTELPNTGGRWPVPESAEVRLITPPQNLFFAPADVTLASSTITYASNWFTYGHPVQFTSTGTLPSGLTTGTIYYVVQTGDMLQVSSTASGSAVPLLTQGSGTHNVRSTFTENVAWDGANISWVNLAVATSTGLPLTRNRIADQFTPVTLADGQGVVVTFTWNAGADQVASAAVVTLPANPTLNQNQILWAQNWNNVLSY